jgi:hypothetical protein
LVEGFSNWMVSKMAIQRMETNQSQLDWMRSFAQALGVCVLALLCMTSQAAAQSVGLPLPRLLTTMPMGGTVGSQVEIVIGGENIDEADQLYFSDPRLTAIPKLNAEGKREPNKYLVTIAPDCPPGIYEARVMTHFGISSARAFPVGTLPEVVQKSPNTSLATAMEIKTNTVCNSVMSAKSADFYFFEAKKDQRYFVDCSAKGIDSKLDAVLVVADSEGRDLLVERRGGIIDFKAPRDGKYVVKVHELTFKGGSDNFYRLTVQEAPAGALIPTPTKSKTVSAFSWPPVGLTESSAASEVEPNNLHAQAQPIVLPCDLAGSFFPAADVDTFQFTAKAGEVWWVELASERLGLPTDASILVQRIVGVGADQKFVDVAEFTDIPSPVKVSSNGYAYDGPPFDAGSPDINGKFEIKEDGLYRLQVTDLFGGTRDDRRNIYRLVIRQAAPDFALVAWPLHMELRNGDRNALSKPIALRGGGTVALEVVTMRRDGFDGDIELAMEGLPDGVTAHGLKIPAGQSRGIMLITAHQDAPRSIANVRFFGRAKIQDADVSRPCHLAEFKWPIPDSWGEIPEPRLVADVPVSVCGAEYAPLTITAKENKVWEVKSGDKLTIPLVHLRRSEFSGSNLLLKTFGSVFERTPQFNVVLTDDQSEATLDTAALQPPPGDYVIAFYGGAVVKYRHRMDTVVKAQADFKKAEQEIANLATEAQRLKDEAASASPERQAEVDTALANVVAQQLAAHAALKTAEEQLKITTERSQPRDIVDIVVTEPITIRVLPTEVK